MPTEITTIGSTKDVAFFQNADFSRQSPVGANGNILNQDGQIWMGMTTPDAYGSTIAVVNIGSKAVTTITGDTGTTVQGAVKLYGHTGSANAGSTVGFNGASATEMDLVVTDSGFNTVIGYSAGNSSLSSVSTNNVGVGDFSLSGLVSGSGSNSALGHSAGSALTTGQHNIAIGDFSLSNGNSSNTIGIGHQAGSNYSTGTPANNILIGNAGVNAETNTIHIGTQGSGSFQQNACFIAGIAGVTASNPTVMTVNSSTGQLGNDTTNFTILSTGLQLKGNNTNTAPPAGFIGEQISSLQTSPVSLSNSTTQTITSISLTAGIWDISGAILYFGTPTGTLSAVNISTTNNTAASYPAQVQVSAVPNAISGLSVSLGYPIRATLSSTTTYYLVAYCAFTVGTVTADGYITATRVG